MFNKNFYPTPKKLIEKMYDAYGRYNNILEPSAGKGDIVDYINSQYGYDNGPNIDVLEIENDLQQILHSKKCNVVGNDFLLYKSHSEYDLIIMNPPFDEGDKHLIRAYLYASLQRVIDCEIICLLNAETIKNPYSNTRKHLEMILDECNATFEYQEMAFSDAERKTNVSTVLVKFKVKAQSNVGSLIYESIVNNEKLKDTDMDSNLTTALSTKVAKQELEEKVKEIKILVRLYNRHIEKLKLSYEARRELELFNNEVEKNDLENQYTRIYTKELDYGNLNFNNMQCDIGVIREYYWERILDTKEFSKVLTNDGRKKLHEQITKTRNLELTEENIYNLIISLIGNKTDMLTDTLVTKFEELTTNHMNNFSKNIHYYNGWKSNDAFKVKTKVITTERRSVWDIHPLYNEYKGHWDNDFKSDNVLDLIKALQLLADYTISDKFTHDGYGLYENETLKVKCYIKGTTHITFKDLNLLTKFNVFVGQQKNWLPTDEEIKNNKEAKDFINKEFKLLKEIK